MQWHSSEEARQLLRAIAEQLKLPLIQIARASELSQIPATANEELLRTIQFSADAALSMVDSYLLGLQLTNDEQSSLELEPVSISSVLNDTAHQLTAVARGYQVDLELSVAGKYAPVMAHQTALRAALVSLGYALIGSQPLVDKRRHVIKLATYRNHQGIVAGIYSDSGGLSAEAFRQAQKLYGHVRQPLTELSNGVAGVFVADTILQAMSTKLRVAHHRKFSGLAGTFQPARQLQLV